MWKNLGLTGKIIVAMVLSMALGLFFNYAGLNYEGGFVNTYLTNGLFDIVGKLFVNSLKMLVVPLVLISLICGVCGIGDIRLLGRIGSKTFLIYMMTTAIAIATAIGLGLVFGIGKGMNVGTRPTLKPLKRRRWRKYLPTSSQPTPSARWQMATCCPSSSLPS